MYLKNITFEVPLATRVYSDTHSICVPSSATDILLFFFGNYLAHAATVKSEPGDNLKQTTLAMALALLCPTTGVIRALKAIRRAARMAKSDLERAARAGALAMVVRRSTWRPENGRAVAGYTDVEGKWKDRESPLSLSFKGEIYRDIVPGSIDTLKRADRGAFEEKQSSWWHFGYASGDPKAKDRYIHGLADLSDEYKLCYVPRDAKVVDRYPSTSKEDLPTTISSSYSLPKTLIALFQTIFAGVTLYQTRGNQIDRYGYASFGLTVTPYLIMSVLNLLAHIATPDFPTLYLVRSPCLDEAEDRGCKFNGVVGQLIPKKRIPDDQGFLKFEQLKGDARLDGPHGSQRVIWTDGVVLVSPCRRDGSPIESRHGPKVLLGASAPTDIPEAVVAFAKTIPFRRHKSPFPHGWLNSPFHPIGPLISSWCIVSAIGALPLIVVGIMTQFKPQHSTLAQRTWTMAWLVCSAILGPYVHVFSSITDSAVKSFIMVIVTGGVIAFIPAIGGFVIVGQMIKEFGNCINVF